MSILLRRVITQVLAGGVNIADVFSIDLWTGNSSARDITTGLDMSGDGGLVWAKRRGNDTQSHALFDTERGVLKNIASDTNLQEFTTASSLTAFNNDGFSLGTNDLPNESTKTFVGWSFKKSANFFDVITYTGDGIAGREIAHALGVQAGLVLIKDLDGTDSWQVQHVARGGTKGIILNSTNAEFTSSAVWNNTTADADNITLGTSNGVNQTSINYVAYVFAHDIEESGVIQCGSYVGTGSTGLAVNLGWKPQYLMIKAATGAGDWKIIDTTRGSLPSNNDQVLEANTNAIEVTALRLSLTATGFTIDNTFSDYNTNGVNYIYMAIREE